MSIGTFFKNIGKKFDNFIDEAKDFMHKKNSGTKSLDVTDTQNRMREIVAAYQKASTGNNASAPCYAESSARELLIQEKITLFQKEHAKEASGNFIDRLTKVFNSSNFRSNPWLYIDRWKEQGKHKRFSEQEQPLALDFFENKLLKEMSPVNLFPLSRDRDPSIQELFKNSSFRENPLLFVRTFEKQQKEDDQELLEILKKSIHIKSIKLDMEYLQEMANQYPLQDTDTPKRNTRDHITAVLTNTLFQKNPALFMEDWQNKRGKGENYRYGEDDARKFFKKHLAVTSISMKNLLNDIQQESKEIRTALKKILYNPIFQRHPLQFLEQLKNKPLSELESTARTWFLSKFDSAPVETKNAVEAEDSVETNNSVEAENSIETDPVEAEILVEANNTIEAEDSVETNNSVEAENSVETDSVEAEVLVEANDAVEAEDLVEANNTIEAEDSVETNNSVEAEDSVETDSVEAEVLVEANDAVEAEILVEANNTIEAENSVETDSVEAENSVETDAVEAEVLVEANDIVEAKVLVEVNDAVEAEDLVEIKDTATV